jgi:hypothetical protein
LAGLVIDMVLYKVLTQQSIHSMAQQTLGAWQRVWWLQTVLTLKMTLILAAND